MKYNLHKVAKSLSENSCSQLLEVLTTAFEGIDSPPPLPSPRCARAFWAGAKGKMDVSSSKEQERVFPFPKGLDRRTS